MKFFQKRGVMLAICVLVVIASTLVNTRWKLGAKVRALDNAFYAADGIAAQLEVLHQQADSLASVAESKGIDAAALRSASDNLQGMLSQRSVSAAQLYPCYDSLRRELSNTRQRLLAVQLSDGEADQVNKSLETIESAKAAIGASGYNEVVRAFQNRYGSAFTRFLASLVGLHFPMEFA